MQRFNIAAKRVKHIIISFVSGIKRSANTHTHFHMRERGVIRSACAIVPKSLPKIEKRKTKNTRILFIREKATEIWMKVCTGDAATPTPHQRMHAKKKATTTKERKM